MKKPDNKKEDRVNLRILECLSQHGRMPYAQLAEMLKLSANAVRDRILAMERRGVILGYQASLSPEAMERPVHVLALMEPGPGRPQPVTELTEHPNVISVAECSGQYGLVVELQAASLDAIHEILRDTLYKHGFELAEFVTLGTPLGQSPEALN